MKYLFLCFSLFTFFVIPQVNSQNILVPAIWYKGAALSSSQKQDSLALLNYNSTVHFGDNPMIIIADKLNRDNTFFAVFKQHTPKKEERPKFETVFAEFHFNGNITKISDAYIHGDKFMRIKSGNVLTGIALNYSDSFRELNLKKGINYTFIKDMPEIDLFELKVYDKRLSPSEMLPIQTYLSIKYGVSLEAGLDYMSIDDIVLWNYKNNASYSKRITGLGRSDYFELNQRQTQNSNDSLFRMGLVEENIHNVLNEGDLAKDSYLMFGDNGAAVSFKEVAKRDFEKLQRVWKYNKTKNFTAKNMYIKLALDQFKDTIAGQEYFLYINNSTKDPINLNSLKLIKGETVDSVLVFKDINIDKAVSNEGYLSLYRRKKFDFDSSWLFYCDGKNVLKLTIEGGEKPYAIKFVDASGMVIKQQKTTLNELEIATVPFEDAFDVVVEDALGNTLKQDGRDIGSQSIPLELKTIWNLDKHGKVLVAPFFTGVFNRTDLKYEWYKDTQHLGSSSEIELKETGSYSLKVSTDRQCFSWPFSVVNMEKEIADANENNKANHSENGVYPNPVKAGEPFDVRVSFSKQMDKVALSVFTLKGQFLTSKEYEKTSHIEYSHILNTEGIYIILIKTEGDTRVFKLIVQ
ncbi:T9SS type A sorting domain-containing protein [Flavobacterium sp. JP2137]|uniref:T9SS type A sorting domain-containing protein n=1 Tax=Flavobacterium sp. JP2137 TaxID=3414510 RepID=UPI003D2FE15A